MKINESINTSRTKYLPKTTHRPSLQLLYLSASYKARRFILHPSLTVLSVAAATASPGG